MSGQADVPITIGEEMFPPMILARIGALCYIVWGLFHVNVAYEIYTLGVAQSGIVQGRLFQLPAYTRIVTSRYLRPWRFAHNRGAATRAASPLVGQPEVLSS
jgi:hypothetical protein